MDFDVAAWSDESSEQAHTRLYFNSEGFLPLIHAMVFFFFRPCVPAAEPLANSVFKEKCGCDAFEIWQMRRAFARLQSYCLVIGPTELSRTCFQINRLRFWWP